MPELPEVETVVRTLRPAVVGARVAEVLHARADMVCPAGTDLATQITGRCVAGVGRRGKRILIALDDGSTLTIHLGMTGQLTVERADAPPKPHTHLRLSLVNETSPLALIELRLRDPRRFGAIGYLTPSEAGDAGLGPEPLGLRPARLAEQLARTKRAIKSALLDQRLIAGLGNIYVDESLFHARIHPLRGADTLRAEEVGRLNRAIKLVLRRAIANRGSSLRDYVDATGLPGSAQKLHRVYGRVGKPCRGCRTPVEGMVLGGRSTHFCPRCQAPQ